MRRAIFAGLVVVLASCAFAWWSRREHAAVTDRSDGPPANSRVDGMAPVKASRDAAVPLAARLDGAAPAVIDVPAVAESPVLDGALHESVWRDTDARSGAFVVGVQAARPHSDARFVSRDGTLWIGLYAADQNIVTGDFFRITLGEQIVTVNARGVVTGPARAACNVDGTIDDAEEDEEWTVEVAFPLPHVQGRVPVVVERCEVGDPTCGRFSATLVLH